MTLQRILVALLLAIAAGRRADAQVERDDPTDVQTRLEASLRLDLPRRWEAELGYRARYMGDSREYGSSDFTTDLGRGVGRGLALIGGYRLRLASDGAAHRFAGGAEIRRRVWDTRFSLRALTQYETRPNAGGVAQGTESRLRVRLRAQQPLGTALSLAASIEPVFDIRTGLEAKGLRHGFDVRYDWSENNRLEISYLLRSRLGDRAPRRSHVIGLGIQHTLKVRGR